ncbi:hypothetical protein NADFUDRAFT_49718 [Nadsonia fulvescens var. elongata DSM 6958]|uniref:PWWP domain-containing protein n=1 Tax=Nadsonia fulvescens var. elongata DSM 6958 TaxID=857566 RepID=A0A1E3PPD8_9ASCO|nr:hypothetical protein NADFUDRAFT_49718 [Nadsonia fulvescens var. elongata DSM 6958]
MSTEDTFTAQSNPAETATHPSSTASSELLVDTLPNTDPIVEEPISQAENAENTAKGLEIDPKPETETETVAPANYTTAVRKAQDEAIYTPEEQVAVSDKDLSPHKVNSEKFKEELEKELQELRDPEVAASETADLNSDVANTSEPVVEPEKTNEEFKQENKAELKREFEQLQAYPATVELSPGEKRKESIPEKSDEKSKNDSKENVKKPSEGVTTNEDVTEILTVEPKAEKSITEPETEGAQTSQAKNPVLETKSSDFSVGDIVLAKVKGFPAWPGMVLSDELVPAAILAAKPRNPGSNPKSKKKSSPGTTASGAGTSVKVWPVRFFNDPTHCWSVKADLKFLSPDEARKYLKGPKGKKDKYLLRAYEIALNPPSVEELVHGSIFEEEEQEEEQDKEMEVEADENMDVDVSASPKKSTNTKRPFKRTTTVAAAKSAAELTTKTKAASKKRKSNAEIMEEPTESASSKKKKTTASSGAKSALAASGQSNASLITKDDESKNARSGDITGTDVNSSSNSTSVATPVPSAKQLSRAYDEKSKEVLMIRHKLQKGFLSKAPEERDMEQLSEILTQLEYFNGLEVAIIRQTKINKVLKAIIRLPQESIPLEDQFKFKPRSMKLLGVWNGWFAEDTRAAVPAPGTSSVDVATVVSDASASTFDVNNPSTDNSITLTPAPENGNGDSNGDSNGAVHE